MNDKQKCCLSKNRMKNVHNARAYTNAKNANQWGKQNSANKKQTKQKKKTKKPVKTKGFSTTFMKVIS